MRFTINDNCPCFHCLFRIHVSPFWAICHISYFGCKFYHLSCLLVFWLSVSDTRSNLRYLSHVFIAYFRNLFRFYRFVRFVYVFIVCLIYLSMFWLCVSDTRLRYLSNFLLSIWDARLRYLSYVLIVYFRHTFEFIEQLLLLWPTHTLERHIAILQEAIKKGISDADSDARVSSRK